MSVYGRSYVLPIILHNAFDAQLIEDTGVAANIDAANPVGAQTQAFAGVAEQLDAATEVGAIKQVVVGVAAEVDAGSPAPATTQVGVGVAAQLDHTPAGSTPAKHAAVGAAADQRSHALPVVPLAPHVVDVGVAAELDVANPAPQLPGPDVPRLAGLLAAIAVALRDCLCTRLLDTVAGQVCRCSLMAGDAAMADICDIQPGGEGQAWVRLTRLFHTVDFPRPVSERLICAGLWAAEFELGVLRCAVMPAEDGTPPGAPELLCEAAKVADDAYAMRWTVECCLPAGLPTVPGEWVPLSSGGCVGGRVTVTVLLTPGPHPLLPDVGQGMFA